MSDCNVLCIPKPHLAIVLFLVSAVLIGCEDRSLLAHKNTLAGFQPASTSDSKDPLQIKGKVTIVWRLSSGKIEVDRFSFDGKFQNSVLDKSSPYPPEVYAQTVDEIDTLIKVACRSVSGSADYKSSGAPSGSSGTRQTYNNTVCDVTVNDYKTKTQLAKTTIGDDQAPSILDDAQYAIRIRHEVVDYLKKIPLELSPGTGANSEPSQ